MGDAEDRVVVDPAICAGKPTIRGTRIMVRNILGMVAGGCTRDQILDAYPELAVEDVESALRYSARALDELQVMPVG